MLSPDFRCKENDGTIWFPSVPVQPGIVTSDYDFHEVGVTVCGVQHVWSPVVPVQPGIVTSDYDFHEVGVTICGVPYGYDPDTKFFRHFPYNENDYEI